LRPGWPNAFEVSAWHSAKLVGIVLLFERTAHRTKFIPVKTLYVNEAGEPELDMTIEYNGFLVNPEFETAATAAMCRFIESHWRSRDELFISGTLSNCAILDYLRDSPLRWKTERQSEGRYVDLTSLRAGDMAFIDTLSRNRRYQIRRSIRAFEKLGPVECTRTEDIATARDWLGELKEHHRIYWESRGRPGAFARPERELFYNALLEYGFSEGTVDLVRVSAGKYTVGMLLNLRKDNIVYYLQSGFAYGLLPKAQPGYVTLNLVIQWYADNGADRFDFLAGGESYKSSLADRKYVLLWGGAQRKRTKFILIELLRSVKRVVAVMRNGMSKAFKKTEG
jgi:hypothetical protein